MNASNSINRLRQFVEYKTVPIDVQEALKTIADERIVIEEQVIGSNSRQVYGFTTLLGPNDDIAISSADQQELLEAHCVGVSERVDSKIARAVTGAKLMQLSCGGSGVSVEAYTHMINAAIGGGRYLC